MKKMKALEVIRRSYQLHIAVVSCSCVEGFCFTGGMLLYVMWMGFYNTCAESGN